MFFNTIINGCFFLFLQNYFKCFIDAELVYHLKELNPILDHKFYFQYLKSIWKIIIQIIYYEIGLETW